MSSAGRSSPPSAEMVDEEAKNAVDEDGKDETRLALQGNRPNKFGTKGDQYEYPHEDDVLSIMQVVRGLTSEQLRCLGLFRDGDNVVRVGVLPQFVSVVQLEHSLDKVYSLLMHQRLYPKLALVETNPPQCIP